MAAPSFIQEAETAWNSATSPKTTASFSVLAGDILVAFLITEGNDNGLWDATITGGSLSWTERQQVAATDYCYVLIATAVVDSNKSMTVSFTRTAGNTAIDFGGNVLTFRSSDGVGASAKENADSELGGPSMNLTTTQANSAVVAALGDWNATSGTRTWRTGAGVFTAQSAYLDTGAYWAGGGYHADAGVIGTYAIGQLAPTGQKHSLVAVEVKGTAAGGTAPMGWAGSGWW